MFIHVAVHPYYMGKLTKLLHSSKLIESFPGNSFVNVELVLDAPTIRKLKGNMGMKVLGDLRSAVKDQFGIDDYQENQSVFSISLDVYDKNEYTFKRIISNVFYKEALRTIKIIEDFFSIKEPEYQNNCDYFWMLIELIDWVDFGSGDSLKDRMNEHIKKQYEYDVKQQKRLLISRGIM